MDGRKLRRRSVAVLLLLAAVTLLASQSAAVSASNNYGDTNVEPLASTLIQQYVVALTKITVTHPTVMQSVSLYVQYTGSDGSQCLKFGIYADGNNGNGPLGKVSCCRYSERILFSGNSKFWSRLGDVAAGTV